MSLSADSDKLMFYCSACGAFNRVPVNKVASSPRCGRCHAALETTGKPVTVDDGNFSRLKDNSPVPVLLDVWAPWCGPCRLVAPVLEQIGKAHAGKMVVAKLNSDENPRIAGELQVRSIPALFVFKGGQVVDQAVGALPRPQIEALLTKWM